MKDERGAYVMGCNYVDAKGKTIKTNIDSYDPESCFGRYANDSLDKGSDNIYVDPDTFEFVDARKKYALLQMIAKKRIRAGQELFLDYDITTYQEYNIYH